MDTFENHSSEEELRPQSQSEIISGGGDSDDKRATPLQEEASDRPETAKRVSPYADSPYVMNCPVEERAKPQKVKKERRRHGIWKRAVCAVLALVLLAGACVITGVAVNDYWEDRVEELKDSFEDRMDQLEKNMHSANPGTSVSGSPVVSGDGGMTPAQVYAKNVESVVLIYNRISTKYNGQVSTGTATGSGFILTEDGYVVTNYHVVEGDGAISVATYAGDEYAAKLVGYDATNDVALLKVDAAELQAVTLGSSNALIVGDQVVAIGNPLGPLMALPLTCSKRMRPLIPATLAVLCLICAARLLALPPQNILVLPPVEQPSRV